MSAVVPVLDVVTGGAAVMEVLVMVGSSRYRPRAIKGSGPYIARPGSGVVVVGEGRPGSAGTRIDTSHVVPYGIYRFCSAPQCNENGREETVDVPTRTLTPAEWQASTMLRWTVRIKNDCQSVRKYDTS